MAKEGLKGLKIYEVKTFFSPQTGVLPGKRGEQISNDGDRKGKTGEREEDEERERGAKREEESVP